MSVLLNVGYKIPFEKIEQLFGDLYSSSFNESTSISANTARFDALQATEMHIKDEILASGVAHFDASIAHTSPPVQLGLPSWGQAERRDKPAYGRG